MAIVSFIGLLAVQVEGLEDGGILHREQDGVLRGIISMFMPGPRRHDEEVAGLADKALAIDGRIPFSPKCVINGTICLPMRLGMHTGPGEFESTGHDRQDRLVAVVAVVVLGRGWDEHQVARLHSAPIRYHRGIGFLPLHDEAKGRGRVSVCWCNFDGQEELYPSARHRCGRSFAPETGIHEGDHPALAAMLDGDQRCRALG